MSKVRNRRLFAFCAITIFLMLSKSTTNANQCQLDDGQYRKKRLNAVRGQILSKLGMSSPPKEPAPELTTEDEEEYRQIKEAADFIDEENLKVAKSCQATTAEDYYSKIMTTVAYVPEWPPIGDKTVERLINARVAQYLKFDFKKGLQSLKENNLTFISSGELRLYSKKNNYDATDRIRQKVEVNRLIKDPRNSSLAAAERKYVGTLTVYPLKSEWIGLDITHVLKEIINSDDPDADLGFEFTVQLSGNDFFASQNIDLTSASPLKDNVFKLDMRLAGVNQPNQQNGPIIDRGDTDIEDENEEGKEPQIVILSSNPRTASIEGQQQQQSSRKKRAPALDRDFCQSKVFEDVYQDNCCLRKMSIDFKKDLGWEWIILPHTYEAFYCSGACPYIWSQDTQHSTVLSLYRLTNPEASAAPCCVPKVLRSLTIMYWENGNRRKAVLSDMSVVSCSCR